VTLSRPSDLPTLHAALADRGMGMVRWWKWWREEMMWRDDGCESVEVGSVQVTDRQGLAR
jgi:hypothetical protein